MFKQTAFRAYAVWAALFALALGFWLWAVPKQPRPVFLDAPVKVADATEFAERAVPGWRRAEAAGRVQTLDVSAPIPGTDAVITLEKAWVTGPEVYISYTVSARDGAYLIPQSYKLVTDHRGRPYRMLGLRLPRLYDGGVSPQGYHDVFRFDAMGRAEVPLHEAYEIVIERWRKPVPGSNRVEYRHGGEIAVPIALTAPPAEEWHTWSLGYELEWQGREVRIEELAVGFGSTRVTASATVLPGEQDPSFGLNIAYGAEVRSAQLVEFAPPVVDDGGRYRFVMDYEPPDEWPVAVTLADVVLGFRSPDTFEVELPWGRYRSDEKTEVLEADRVSVQIHDTELRLFAYGNYGSYVILEEIHTRPDPPRVIFASMLEATVEGDRGTVFIAPGGEVISSFGAGSGVVWEANRPLFRRQQIIGHDAFLPEDTITTGSWATADHLLMRIMEPRLKLEFDGTWELRP